MSHSANKPQAAAERQRLHYIDNLRVLACFLVLLTHSAMPATDAAEEGVWLFGLSFLGSPSSELFLTLSGTVLLPVKTGFRRFYSRRFIKLIPPLVIWSVLGVLLYTRTHDMPWSMAVSAIAHMPFQPAIGIYWFVYVMAGLYLLAPFISPWLRGATKRQLQFFIVLWVVNLMIPWINYLLPGFIPTFNVNGNYYWCLNSFGGFIGYWLLGYYLNRYPIKMSVNLPFITLITLAAAYPAAIYMVKRQGADAGSAMDNLQAGSAVMVALLYTLLQNVRFTPPLQHLFTNIAKYSFGIYLTHIYIARELYWGLFDGSQIHIFPRTFIIALLTLITGYVLTRALSYLPKGRYIAGL